MWKEILIHMFSSVLPSFIRKKLKICIFRLRYRYKEKKHIEDSYKEALIKLKEKDRIRCVFLSLFASTWKYDKLYELMVQNPRFDPIILVCPIVNKGRESMLRNLFSAYEELSKKGYNVICSYDSVKDTYVDLKKEIKPDIIIYLNPYKGLIDSRYYITEFNDILTCYIPYYINNTVDYENAYDTLLHKSVWRYYVESYLHKELSVKYSTNSGINCFVAGYPGIEHLVDKNHIPLNQWKIKDKKLKRIIWAPHQTIEAQGVINYSCFLYYYDFMLRMADKYKEKIQFVFKPHPLLINRLYNKWGKVRTDEYYEKWKNLPNGTIVEGAYDDLFMTSDALIHDCASFIAEYLYVNKPVMRTSNGVDIHSQFNDFGIRCLEQHYIAYNEEQIESFIQNVINDVDPLKSQRTEFVNGVLMPKGSPSQMIIDDILDSIDNQILYRN